MSLRDQLFESKEINVRLRQFLKLNEAQTARGYGFRSRSMSDLGKDFYTNALQICRSAAGREGASKQGGASADAHAA